MVDDDLDAGIRALLREPASPSAQERAISFAATRLELDMAEVARLRRGDHRRRLGRALVALCLLLVVALGVASTVDSRFLGRVLGEDVLDTPIDGVTTVSNRISSLDRSYGHHVPDEWWRDLQQVGARLAAAGTPLDRDHARILLRYDEPGVQVRIAAARTKDDDACFLAQGAVATSGCAAAFDMRRPLTARVERVADRSSVIGLAADEVRSVTIELPGEDRVAVLRNNAFLWHADHAADAPQGVIAELTDGTRVHVPLANAPGRHSLAHPG